MFNELDVDGSGLLDTEELLSALQATHQLRLSEAELHQLLNGMDIRFQGHLSFQQFVSQFASMDEWESLFRIWATRRRKRMAAAAAAATSQPATARSRPATTHPTDRPVSPPFRPPPVSPVAPSLLTPRPASSVTSSRQSTALNGSTTATPDVDVLVPFLLWVPAFHRLQLLDSLMAVQLTPEEEAAVRQSATAPSSTSSADTGAATGLSLLDLWRVTRTQVRRKRMESEKAETMRLRQLQAAEGGRGKRTKAGTLDDSSGEEEKVVEIWLELHGERERQLEERRKWRAAHNERRTKQAGHRGGEESVPDGGAERIEAFELFKQAAQMAVEQRVE